MNIVSMVKQSVTSIAHNPVRSALTVLGIVIGIAAVISLMGISRGLQEQVTSGFAGLNPTRVTISTADPQAADQASASLGPGPALPEAVPAGTEPTLTLDDYRAVSALPSVAAASPQSQGRLSVATERGGQDSQVQVQAVSTDYLQMSDLTVSSGNWLEGNGVKQVVLGADVAQDLFGKKDPLGKTVYIDSEPVKVTGVLAESQSSFGTDPDSQIIMGYRTYLRITDTDAFTTVLLDATQEDVVPALQADAENVLLARHEIEKSKNADFSVSANQELLTTISDVGAGFTTTLTAVAAISLLVGGIGIMNVMLMSVTERTREVGLRRAIGAKRWHILSQFLTESVVLTTIGGLIGVAVGYLIGGSIGALMPSAPGGGASIQAIMEASTAGLALALAVVIGVIFGIVPAMRAARLDPAEALRYE